MLNQYVALPVNLMMVLISLVLSWSALLPGERHQNTDPMLPMSVPQFVGYTGRYSYFPGQDIDFHVSSPNADRYYKLFVFREGSTRPLIHVQQSDMPASVNLDLNDSEFGYEWDTTLTISGSETANWASGYYFARLESDTTTSAQFVFPGEYIQFIVKPRAPSGKILVQLPTNTHMAYNDRFGRSYYTSPRTFKTSTHRPQRWYLNWLTTGTHNDDVADIAGYYLRWLEAHNYQFDVIANSDIEDDAILNPDNYRLFISVGHDEYWTHGMRDTLQSFVDGGGNVIFFSSNDIYYQARYEDDQATLTSYKIEQYAAPHDPMWNVNNSLVTTFWALPPVNNPETRLAGLSYHYGGPGIGGYKVYFTNDWVFQNTGLANGQTIGNYAAIGEDILAQEVDATEYVWSSGLPYVTNTATTGTPDTFKILGVNADPTSAHAIMGYYTNSQGATVFHAGSWDWWKGLILSDPIIEQITNNLLVQLSAGAVTPQPVPSHPVYTTVLRNGVDDYYGTEDTTIDYNSPTTNYGNAETLGLQHNRSGDRRAVLVKFGLGDLSPWADVVSARLTLYPVSLQSGSELKASRLAPSAQWNESAATWNSPDGQSSWPEGSATSGISLENEFIRVMNRGINYELTGLVQGWLADPATNAGVALRGNTTYVDNWSYAVAEIASSEYPNVDMRPKLVVQYQCHIPGDVDENGVVDLNDLVLVANNWNCYADPPSGCYDRHLDLDLDNDIDIVDLQLALSHWQASCFE